MNVNAKDTMLIFDLDGTLWDSSENVAKSWNIILERKAFELANITGADIKAMMGKTMAEIADIMFGSYDEKSRKSIAKECAAFEVEYITKHGGVLFPHVKETLDELKKQNFKMAIVSNCQIGYVDSFLKSMEMERFFCDFEEWESTMMPKSHNIRLVMKRNNFEKAVYIGDTAKDMRACKKADVPFIHAAYGFGKIDEDVPKINSFSELLNIFGGENG